MTPENDHDLLIKINENVNGMKSMLEDYMCRTVDLEETATTNKTKIEIMQQEIDRLRGQSYFWNAFNTIAVGIGTALALIFGNNK
jgi:hypothetical protein